LEERSSPLPFGGCSTDSIDAGDDDEVANDDEDGSECDEDEE
jgi:hypothetical protein